MSRFTATTAPKLKKTPEPKSSPKKMEGLQDLVNNAPPTYISLSEISPDATNPRYGDRNGISIEEMEALVKNEKEYPAFFNSIFKEGVVKPVLVVQIISPVRRKYALRAGFRRWCAAKEAKGLNYKIPAIILPATTSELDIHHLMSIEEGNLQKRWTDYNFWLHRSKLLKMGLTIEDIAVEQSTSIATVKSRLEAIKICQDYLKVYPKADPPWSITFELCRIGTKGLTPFATIIKDANVRKEYFRQVNSGQVRDSHGCRDLLPILNNTGLRAIFMTQGFEAAVKEYKDSKNDCERLTLMCQKILSSTSRKDHFDKYVGRIQHNRDDEEVVLKTISALVNVCKAAGKGNLAAAVIKEKS
jgi:hypothetical protein